MFHVVMYVNVAIGYRVIHFVYSSNGVIPSG